MLSRQNLFWLFRPCDLPGTDQAFLRAVRDCCAGRAWSTGFRWNWGPQRERGPSAARNDSGLSLALLPLLVETQPSLAPWIHAFEISSQDTDSLRRLAGQADGTAVLGGDGAVTAVRALAPPDCRLVEWGHRLSFACWPRLACMSGRPGWSILRTGPGPERSSSGGRDVRLHWSGPGTGAVAPARKHSGQMLAPAADGRSSAQTAGLICVPVRRAERTALLSAAGVTRITRPGHMSDAFSGEVHDGEYPLRRCCRMVDIGR